MHNNYNSITVTNLYVVFLSKLKYRIRILFSNIKIAGLWSISKAPVAMGERLSLLLSSAQGLLIISSFLSELVPFCVPECATSFEPTAAVGNFLPPLDFNSVVLTSGSILLPLFYFYSFCFARKNNPLWTNLHGEHCRGRQYSYVQWRLNVNCYANKVKECQEALAPLSSQLPASLRWI